MKYGRKRIGPKFGQTVAQRVHDAITAGNRDNYEAYRAAVEDIYQMLDTVAEEAGFEQHFTRETKQEAASVAGDAAAVEAPDTDVVPESKPAPKSAGRKKAPAKGSRARKPAGGQSGDTDTGSVSDTGASGSGSGDGEAADA